MTAWCSRQAENCRIRGSDLIENMKLDQKFCMRFTTELTWLTAAFDGAHLVQRAERACGLLVCMRGRQAIATGPFIYQHKSTLTVNTLPTCLNMLHLWCGHETTSCSSACGSARDLRGSPHEGSVPPSSVTQHAVCSVHAPPDAAHTLRTHAPGSSSAGSAGSDQDDSQWAQWALGGQGQIVGKAQLDVWSEVIPPFNMMPREVLQVRGGGGRCPL
jgi:hypothetical protein